MDLFLLQNDGQISDFVSFYTLPSTVMHHPTHKSLKAAYSFYSCSAKTPWVDLMQDALTVAKNVRLFLLIYYNHNIFIGKVTSGKKKRPPDFKNCFKIHFSRCHLQKNINLHLCHIYIINTNTVIQSQNGLWISLHLPGNNLENTWHFVSPEKWEPCNIMICSYWGLIEGG